MNTDLQQQLAAGHPHVVAPDRSMTCMELGPDGSIINTNENLLTLLGYRYNEVLGKSHHQLCDGAYAQSEDYRHFWECLRRGGHFSGRYKCITREGRPLQLEATYNSVCDRQDRLLKVIKYAGDIDTIVHREYGMQSRPGALSYSMTVTKFDFDSNALAANDNFLTTMDYGRTELANANHRRFCEPGYRDDPQHTDLWCHLDRGECAAGQFRRVHHNGQSIWLETSCSPVYDADGKLFKVVKLANDVSDRMRHYQAEADNVHQIHTPSTETRTVAEHGASIIQNAVEEILKITNILDASSLSIGRLSQRSQQITSIINIIRETAEQANLLAFSAAVKVTRAGDQGHGFAMVVDKVWQLAECTSKSTREIADMIGHIQTGIRSVIDDMQYNQEQTRRGMELANEVGTVILSIRESTHKTVEAAQRFSRTFNVDF